MTLSLSDRHVGSKNPDYLARVAQAMIQHAVYLVFKQSHTDAELREAATVLAAPGHHATRAGYWILNHASMNELESVDLLEDSQIASAVQTIWPMYHGVNTISSGGD